MSEDALGKAFVAAIVLVATAVIFYFVQWAHDKSIRHLARAQPSPSKTKAPFTLTWVKHMPAAIRVLGLIGVIVLFGVGAFFLALGYQADHTNLFGQKCGGTYEGMRCIHPE